MYENSEYTELISLLAKEPKRDTVNNKSNRS